MGGGGGPCPESRCRPRPLSSVSSLVRWGNTQLAPPLRPSWLCGSRELCTTHSPSRRSGRGSPRPAPGPVPTPPRPSAGAPAAAWMTSCKVGVSEEGKWGAPPEAAPAQRPASTLPAPKCPAPRFFLCELNLSQTALKQPLKQRCYAGDLWTPTDGWQPLAGFGRHWGRGRRGLKGEPQAPAPAWAGGPRGL